MSDQRVQIPMGGRRALEKERNQKRRREAENTVKDQVLQAIREEGGRCEEYWVKK